MAAEIHALLLRQIPGAIAIGGGVPIKNGNETVGAVGIGDAHDPGADEACPNARVEKIAAQRRQFCAISHCYGVVAINRRGDRYGWARDKAALFSECKPGPATAPANRQCR